MTFNLKEKEDYSCMDDTQRSSRTPKEEEQNEGKTGLCPYDLYLWVKRKVYPEDVKIECRTLLSLAWALSINSFLAFLIPLTMLFVIGHLSKDSLAAAGLGLSFCNLTGMVFGIGLITACDTLMSQAYGAENHRRVGIVAQRAIVMSIVAMLPIIALWINSEKLLLALGQKPETSKLAGQFITCFIPALFLFVGFNILIRYLACQGITTPSVFAAIFAAAVNGIFCYLFCFYFNLGVRGGAFAVDLAYLALFLYLFIYICIKERHSDTWQGWSWECFDDWPPFLALGLPSILMVGMEWWCFELGIFALGVIGETYQATQIILYNVAGCVYFLFFGLSLAASVRIGNFIGAACPIDAKRTMRVAIVMSAVCSTLLGLLIIILKDVLGYLFTKDRAVIAMSAKTMYIVGLAEMVDGLQVVLMGFVRGLGLQKYGAAVTFVGNICIATPIYCVLIFVAKLGVIGFWTGIIIGVIFLIIGYSLLAFRSDLNKLCDKARERAGICQSPQHVVVKEHRFTFEDSKTNANGNADIFPDREDDLVALVEKDSEDDLPSQGLSASVVSDANYPVSDSEISRKFMRASETRSVSFILIKAMIMTLSVLSLIIGIFIRIYL